MKILHILSNGPTGLSDRVIKAQGNAHEIKIVDLDAPDLDYSSVVDEIFSCDRVITW